MAIERAEADYKLDQGTYIDSLLQKNGMTDSFKASIFIETHAELEIRGGDIDVLVDKNAYLAIAGYLMLAVLGTRPGTSYAVGLFSR